MKHQEARSRKRYPFAAHANKKADDNIMPFLKLLWDQKLIECDTNPKDSSLETRIKVQKFVYFAQQRFGLKFRYMHTMYLFGPYSTALTNDYYRIQKIGDAPEGGLEQWDKKGKFLEFAKEHNDVNWLEIASTIVYIHDKDLITEKDELIERTRTLKFRFEKDYIVQVHRKLEQMGFLGV